MRDADIASASFDYIVVGAGSSGAAVAARLSEDPDTHVLLIEAGPSNRRLWTQIPLGYAKTFNDPEVNWCYTSEPNRALDGRRLYVPRGKVLGGSSAINAMVYARGSAADFDGWEALGNPGWGWREISDFYRLMEDHAYGPADGHGKGGPVHVADVKDQAHPLCRRFMDAAGAAGFSYSRDLNGASPEGVGYYQITASGRRRVSSASAYLDKARGRANLTILTGVEAQRVSLSGRKADGVVCIRGGVEITIRCNREVILSAGAINSPKLLLLSGIGPAEELKDHGIAPVHDLAAVGRNLQDHASFDLFYDAKVPTLNTKLASMTGLTATGLEYLLFGRGALATSLNQAGGFVKTLPSLSRPDVQLYFCPMAYEKPPVEGMQFIKVDARPRYSLSASLCHPASRGSVKLASPNPVDAPRIDLNLLDDERDMADAVRAFHLLRQIGNNAALVEVGTEEKPGATVESDDDIRAFIRQTAYSIFHPCGTCAMGPDPEGSVVDASLRVHGIDGLRVIDASIFPLIPSGNTNAPAMVVGERGAALMGNRGAVRPEG